MDSRTTCCVTILIDTDDDLSPQPQALLPIPDDDDGFSLFSSTDGRNFAESLSLTAGNNEEDLLAQFPNDSEDIFSSSDDTSTFSESNLLVASGGHNSITHPTNELALNENSFFESDNPAPLRGDVELFMD